MTSASSRVGTLDRRLAHGESIIVRAHTGTGNARTVSSQVTVRAVVRPAGRLDTGSIQLVGIISQNDRIVITSPTEMSAFDSGAPAPEDKRVPRKGNTAVVAGKEYSIEAGAGVIFDDVLVRIEMHLRG